MVYYIPTTSNIAKRRMSLLSAILIAIIIVIIVRMNALRNIHDYVVYGNKVRYCDTQSRDKDADDLLMPEYSWLYGTDTTPIGADGNLDDAYYVP